jgi:glycosyltransferase involved in cell wall biosynthesis
VVRPRRPPERPLNALGLPPGTSHAPLAWLALRRGHADVVQAWTAPAALAAARSGRPSIFVFQGLLHPDDLAGRPRVRSMLLRAARGCDVVTTYSAAAAAPFTEQTGIPARAVNPGIRVDRFAPGGRRHPSPAVFCAADPGEPRKRVGLLVDAFQRVRAAHPEAELWLMVTRDQALASAPGVRIVEPGADQERLVDLYRSAWVTVMPAYREAFGLVVVESLACGTPVIGMTDGGAVPQILAGADPTGLGAVCEPDPGALAAALEPFLAAAPDDASVARRRTRAEDFSIERCADEYEALYAELTSRRSPAAAPPARSTR